MVTPRHHTVLLLYGTSRSAGPSIVVGPTLGATQGVSGAFSPTADHDQAVKDGWLQPPPNANSWAQYCDKQLGWD